MVHNPFDNENSTDDPRKAKLRNQAQKQFIVQLQQTIANQSAKIEELEAQIIEINKIINQKDSELEDYSKRLEEQRYYHEEDKKSRKSREHELTKLLQQKELEIKKLKEAPIPLQESSFPEQEVSTSVVGNKVNEFVNNIIAYYRKPTHDVFVHSLQDLVKHCSSQGTIEQQILGILLKSEMPLIEDNIVQQLNSDIPTINRALFRLVQQENVKKVGQGYVIISSDFAEMTDVTRNWGSLAPEQIYENLLSVVYVGGSREELLDAFAKARDALMEMGALSTLVTHEMSQYVDKIKKYPIETEELVEIIQKWKSAIKE